MLRTPDLELLRKGMWISYGTALGYCKQSEPHVLHETLS